MTNQTKTLNLPVKKTTWLNDFSPLLWVVGIFTAIAVIGCAIEEYFIEKEPFSNVRYLCYTLEMEGAMGEREWLEREVAEIQRQERIENGTPTEKDIEHTIERISYHNA